MAEVTRIGVVGAGTMGHGIAQVAAQAGLDVTLADVAPAALERGLVGFLVAEGPERPEIYKPHSTETAAGH